MSVLPRTGLVDLLLNITSISNEFFFSNESHFPNESHFSNDSYFELIFSNKSIVCRVRVQSYAGASRVKIGGLNENQ